MTAATDNGAGFFARASTATIIVHGVGDHVADDILKETERGLRAAIAAEGMPIAVTKLDSAWLLPDGAADFTAGAIALGASDQMHIVVVLVWSSTRARIGGALRPKDAFRKLFAVAIENPYNLHPGAWAIGALATSVIWWKTARLIVRSVMPDILGLPWRSRGAGWRAAVSMAVPALLGIAGGWILAGVGVVFALSWWALVMGSASLEYWESIKKLFLHGRWSAPTQPFGLFDYLLPPFFSWWAQDEAHWALLTASIVAVSLFTFVGAQVVDFIADVASYVSDDPRRDRVLDVVKKVVQQVKDSSGNARVLVVGHSLGSVVASHAVMGELTGRPVTLVTLGSPLPIMARAFSKAVNGPAELYRRYENTGSVDSWLHAFRDADFIGRSLHIEPGGRFFECGLGAGLHWNYLSDSRLWRRVVALVRTDPTSGYDEFRTTLNDWALDRGERAEIMGSRILMLITLACLLVSIAAYSSISQYLFARDAIALLEVIPWYAARALWTASGIFSGIGALVLLVALSADMRSKQDRKRLRSARLWRPFLLLLPSLQALSVSAALLICVSKN